jgi:hypothetical protein
VQIGEKAPAFAIARRPMTGRMWNVHCRIVAALAGALMLGGCASKSSEVTATYISPMAYQSHSCQQLVMEAQAVSAKAAELSGAQDQKRTNDQIATGVAIVVFWPAAFFVGGDGQIAAQLSQMKGQMSAIEQASIAKKCGIQFQRQPAPQT